MAIKYLNNITLENNALQNATLHPTTTDPSGAIEGQVYYNTAQNQLRAHNGTAFYSVNGKVESLSSGNTNTITIAGTDAVPTVTAVTAAIVDGGTGLATADQIHTFVTDQIAGVGNTTYDLSLGTLASNAAPIQLTGSDASNDIVYVEGVSGGNIKITNPAVGYIGLSLVDNPTIAGDLTVTGDLTVNGTVTTVNSETVSVADNIIVLNNNVTGTPTENAGVEIERGTSSNVSLRWNEATDRWTFTNNGSTFYNMPITGDFNPTIGTDTDYSVTGVNIIKSLTLTDGVITSATTGAMQSATTAQSGVVELATNSETSTGTDTTRAVTPAGLASVLGDQLSSSNHNSWLIGDGTNTTLTVTHSWGHKNYIAQLVEESSGETVFAEIARPTVNTTTVTFTSAPASNAYRLHLISTNY